MIWYNMRKNAYNVIWVDDEIDCLLDDSIKETFRDKNFEIIPAHNGMELENILRQGKNQVDAVIVDANFSEAADNPRNERDTSGLDYARGIYRQMLNMEIPFFLFTGRRYEMLQERYADNPGILEDFPYYSKTIDADFDRLLDDIRKKIESDQSPGVVIRKRFGEELKAAGLIPNADDFVYEFLVRDYCGTLSEPGSSFITPPFNIIRGFLEQLFCKCANLGLIPPISNDMTGTANYLFKGEYQRLNQCHYKKVADIIPKPLASMLLQIVRIVQDGSHNKDGLELRVQEYYNITQDTLFLKSIVYVLIDTLKWFYSVVSERESVNESSSELWTNE